MTLARRRAQVRQDLSAARTAAIGRQVNRIPGKRRTGRPDAAPRTTVIRTMSHGTLRTRYVTAPAARRATAGPIARAGASPAAASAINGWVGESWITGANGILSGYCGNECPADTPLEPPQAGSGYPGEQVTDTAEVWNDDQSGATHQMQVTWYLECNQNEWVPLTSKTVSAPSTFSNASNGTLAQATVTVNDPTSACSANGFVGSYPSYFFVGAWATVTDSSYGAPQGPPSGPPTDIITGGAITRGIAEGISILSVPVQQIAGPICQDSIGGGGGLAQMLAGDPVDTATGECNEVATDASLQAPGYPLAATRSYSPALTAAGPLGPGWTLPWFASASPQSNGDVIITAENGDQYYYTLNSDGSFTPPPGTRSVLAQQSSGNYVLTTPDHETLTFSGSGQLVSMDDRTGRGLAMSYTGSQLTGITDAAGHSVSLSYTGALLTQISLPGGATVKFGYTNGYLTTATDPGGNTTTYGYDSSGRLNSIQDADGNYQMRNTYDSSNRVTQQQDGTGAITKFSYTTLASGETETDITDPDGGIWTNIYGGNVLMESIDPAGETTFYVFNANLQPVQVTDPLGNITQMGYDGNGNLASVTDPLNHEQQWAYDTNNNVTTYTDANNNSTSYTYNSMNEVTSVTAPDGGKTTYTYDSSGNLTSQVDPRGNVSGANAASYTTSYAYNGSGQLESVTNADGGKTSYTRDPMGFPLTITDPMGRVTTFAYDGDQQPVSVTGPDGGTMKYSYDPAGNMVSETDPNGSTYTYGFDADNRVVKVTDPLGNSVSYGYDGNGNQTTFTDARSITTTTSYDADSQPVKITYSDGTPTVTYTYDADGNTTSVTDGTGTRTLVYDAAGELTSAAGPGSGSFSYGYDPAGNITSRTYPDGTKASYTYNSDGQIASLASGSATTSYSYDPAGNLVATTEPNGVTESRSYDNAGQLTGITDAKAGAALDADGLTLNGDGQPTQVAVTQDGTAQATQYYTYDSGGRLASACYSASGPSACSAGSAGTVTGSAPDPAPQGAPSGAVTNGVPGKCMDDSGDSTTAGGMVDIYSCNGSAGQDWTVQGDGTIRINGQCLDVKGQGTTNGSLIDHYTCNGQANQQWQPGSNHSLENPVSGMCLSDPNASTTDGTQLIIAPCYGNTQQEWRLPSTGLAPAGPLTSGLAGKCLDDQSGLTTNGNPVDISSCNGTAAQNWTVGNDGTVRAFGRCLDIKAQGTANNTLIDLYPCNGQANQVWEPSPDGYLINPQSGKCLDDPASSTTDGTQLEIYTCNGGSNQVWTLPTTTAPAAPTSVKVTAGAASAALSWTPPTTSGSTALTGYTITASPGGATATTGPYNTTATIAGLAPGTAYTFTVTATNHTGSATSAATTAVTPGSETTYSYDHAGNLTSSQTDGLTTTSTYNPAEQLTQSTTGTTNTNYTYDADGNLTSAGNQTYTYNGAGQMSAATTPAGTFTYGHDAGGNLSTTDLNGSLIQGTRWDANSILPLAAEDTSASGATTADYLYGPGGQLASVAAGGATYGAVTDWLGSVTGLISSSGTQVTSSTYSAYGTASTTDLNASAPGSSIGYAGSYTQPGGTGLDDMRARDYSPATGAFSTVDPMLSATDQPYMYASGDPVTNTDPTGSITCPDWLPGCGAITKAQNGISAAARMWAQGWMSGWLGKTLCSYQSGSVFVTTPRGISYKIPDGWIGREARNRRGIIFQRPGADGDADSIRIMEPNAQNPNGYVTIYNSKGQPLDSAGSPGNPEGRSAYHIPEDELGDFPELPIP